MSRDDEIEDPSFLRDTDWIEVNNLRREYDRGGSSALRAAWKDLVSRDTPRAGRIFGAYFPRKWRETLLDTLADVGLTVEELEEMLREFEGDGTKH